MGLEVCDVCAEIFLYTMLSVGAADTALLDTGMEALDSLEVETIDVSLTKFEFSDAAGSVVDVVGED